MVVNRELEVQRSKEVATWLDRRRFAESMPREALDEVLAWLKERVEEFSEPQYTIPEDTPVDARVWVRDADGDEWEPWHFAGINKEKCTYKVWIDGATSFSAEDGFTVSFRQCITDEEYQRRKKEGTL